MLLGNLTITLNPFFHPRPFSPSTSMDVTLYPYRVNRSDSILRRPTTKRISFSRDDAARVSAERFTVFCSGSDRPDTYVCTTQAYADSEYKELLQSAGFTSVQRRVSPADAEPDDGAGLVMITAVASAP